MFEDLSERIYDLDFVDFTTGIFSRSPLYVCRICYGLVISSLDWGFPA